MLLDFFTAGPARIKGLLWGAGVLAVVSLSLTGWALLERLTAERLRTELARTIGERDRALDQVKHLNAGIEACNAGVAEAKKAAAGAVDTSRKLLAEARRLTAGSRGQVQRIEDLLRQKPPTRADGTAAGCDDAWTEIERIIAGQKQKARGP